MENMQFEKMLDDRFGMFVHYGIYSAFAGNYKGKWISGLGEWIQRRAEIPIAEYEEYGKKYFHTAPDFAKNLAKSAKNAGIRYIVLTSKHHDGFCLFNSAVSDYNSYAFYGRDICRELVDACREEGLEVGFYYSHTLDWHERDGAGNVPISTGRKIGNRNYWDFPDDNIDFEKYFTEKCIPQVKELLTNYGDLKLIWFDYPHDITLEQSERLRDVVKSLQSNCQINSRIAFGQNDYISLGDNALPVAPTGENLECLVTLNDTWGYRKDDQNWKTPEEVIGILCRTLTSNSSLLMNVGPMADGSLTPETHKILKEMGKWTAVNAEAVYDGVRGNPLPTTFPWGYIAVKGNCIYMYVKDKTVPQLAVASVTGEIASVSLLGEDKQIGYTYADGKLVIDTCETELTMPVYKVAFCAAPVFGTEIVQYDDKVQLGALHAKIQKNDVLEAIPCNSNRTMGDYDNKKTFINGTALLENWTDPAEVLCWDVKFNTPGVYEAELIHALYSPHGTIVEAPDPYTLTVGAEEHPVNTETEKGQFRLSKSSISNVRVIRDAGRFTIAKPGTYRVALTHKAGENVLPLEEIKLVKTH